MYFDFKITNKWYIAILDCVYIYRFVSLIKGEVYLNHTNSIWQYFSMSHIF